MKKLILALLFCISIQSKAQLIIGKQIANGSGIVDFALNLKGGIILPRVTELPIQSAASSNGTILVNATDLNSIRVQVRQNDEWVDLTDPKVLPYTDMNYSPDTGESTIIGSISSSVSGVLVLETTKGALILPKVSNINEYNNAVIGTLFYDLATKSLAVYDGTRWILWK